MTRYFNCGFDKPVRPDGVKLLPGDKVRFSFEENQYGFNVDMSSLQVKAEAVPTDDNSGKQSGGGSNFKKGGKQGGNSRDEYWEKKEAFDKTVTQPLIFRQHCNNVAATLVAQALDKDILPLPTKKGEKFDAYMECYRQVRDSLFEELAGEYAKLGGPDVMSALIKKESVEDIKDPSVDDLKDMDDFDEQMPDDWSDSEDQDSDDWD